MRAPAEQSEAALAKPVAKLSGLRFLVFEDESLIALDLMDRLEKAGAAVALPVSTENEALQVIEYGAQFDCALVDANLHGRPVDDIAAALTRCKIPFVFVTGYGQAGLPPSFKHAPVVPKPVNDDQLFDTVTRIAAKPGKVVRLKS
jgi:CheY-like chemotaxis protein